MVVVVARGVIVVERRVAIPRRGRRAARLVDVAPARACPSIARIGRHLVRAVARPERICVDIPCRAARTVARAEHIGVTL